VVAHGMPCAVHAVGDEIALHHVAQARVLRRQHVSRAGAVDGVEELAAPVVQEPYVAQIRRLGVLDRVRSREAVGGHLPPLDKSAGAGQRLQIAAQGVGEDEIAAERVSHRVEMSERVVVVGGPFATAPGGSQLRGVANTRAASVQVVAVLDPVLVGPKAARDRADLLHLGLELPVR